MQERSRHEWEQLLNRAEDRREIKNLMGIFSNSLMLFLDEELKNTWSSQEDICLGLNHGWYIGRREVARYFQTKRENDAKKAAVLQKIFPDKLGEDSPADTLKGVGILEEKPMANPVIEIAGDRKTAKGIWYSQGSYSDITSRGPMAFWTWGCFAVDFVREDGHWKIWHLQYLEDIKGPVGTNSALNETDRFPKLPEFEDINTLEDAAPTRKETLREYYSPYRPFTKLIRMPEPYDVFEKTFSYGYKEG